MAPLTLFVLLPPFSSSPSLCPGGSYRPILRVQEAKHSRFRHVRCDRIRNGSDGKGHRKALRRGGCRYVIGADTVMGLEEAWKSGDCLVAAMRGAFWGGGGVVVFLGQPGLLVMKLQYLLVLLLKGSRGRRKCSSSWSFQSLYGVAGLCSFFVLCRFVGILKDNCYKELEHSQAV